MPVYALGFPRGRYIQRVVGSLKDNPAITVNRMSISSLRKDDRAAGTRELNSSAIEGNSGGRSSTSRGGLWECVPPIRGEAVGSAPPM